jgi:hypothetical protein
MKIFYISYWGVNEGLTVSTVFPNLRILSEYFQVKQIDFYTMERDRSQTVKDYFSPIAKVTHRPVYSKNLGFFLLTKIADWLRIRSTIISNAKTLKPDLVICRGAMAGAFGTLLYKKFGIPFIVESFEPHADYMLESGVWNKKSIRYKFQKKSESEIKKHADFLITVSQNYFRHLQEVEGILPERLKMVPCMVNAADFAFNQQNREVIRNKFGIEANVKVGIYLGKFGSIYYDEEAFQLFKAAERYFKGNFFLFLLSPTPVDEIIVKLRKVDFPLDKVWIGTAPHKEVPDYLSASDFAFSTIKPADCRRFCSPVKDGEYWANGLPILLPDMVGDDSDIIKKEGAGAIFDIKDPDNIQNSFEIIETLISSTIEGRSKIAEIAKKYRNFDLGKAAYEEIMGYYASKKLY